MMAAAWIVYVKELTDALRDRRTLMMVLLTVKSETPSPHSASVSSIPHESEQ